MDFFKMCFWVFMQAMIVVLPLTLMAMIAFCSCVQAFVSLCHKRSLIRYLLLYIKITIISVPKEVALN